jgi:hypothetical protein
MRSCTLRGGQLGAVLDADGPFNAAVRTLAAVGSVETLATLHASAAELGAGVPVEEASFALLDAGAVAAHAAMARGFAKGFSQAATILDARRTAQVTMGARSHPQNSRLLTFRRTQALAPSRTCSVVHVAVLGGLAFSSIHVFAHLDASFTVQIAVRRCGAL